MTTVDITAAILIIGNEVLSGRTQDINVAYIAKTLTKLGISLLEVRIVPDQEERIIEAVQALSSRYTYLFTTGGIGATHDDITAASVAKAFQIPLVENPKALTILQNYYGDRFNEIRRRMARMPVGSELISNPVSTAPAFQIHNVFCLAGMPSVMQKMFDSLVPQLKITTPFYHNTVTCNLMEGNIGKKLEEIQRDCPDVEIGSYPFYQLDNVGVSLVIRGKDKRAIQKATCAIIEMVKSFEGDMTLETEVPLDEAASLSS